MDLLKVFYRLPGAQRPQVEKYCCKRKKHRFNNTGLFSWGLKTAALITHVLQALALRRWNMRHNLDVHLPSEENPFPMRQKYWHRRSLKPSVCYCGDVGSKRQMCVKQDPLFHKFPAYCKKVRWELWPFWIAKDVAFSPAPSLQSKRKGKRHILTWYWWEAHFNWSGGISDL